MAGDLDHRLAGAAPDRSRRPFRFVARRVRGAARHRLEAASAAISTAPRSVSGGSLTNAPSAFCQDTDRPDRSAVHRGGHGVRIRQYSPIQRQLSSVVQPHADPVAGVGAALRRQPFRALPLLSPVSSAVRLACAAAFRRAARDSRRGGGGRRVLPARHLARREGGHDRGQARPRQERSRFAHRFPGGAGADPDCRARPPAVRLTRRSGGDRGAAGAGPFAG